MASQKGITLKYIVIGDSGVGKTNLLCRYCEDSFHSDYLSTIGVDFKIKRIEFEGQQVTLNIWDTAGQQRFRNITKSFYKGAHGIILAYSIVDADSYRHIEHWMDQLRESGNPAMRTILVATKADMDSDRKVTQQQGEELASRYEMSFVETSARDGVNVAEAFDLLTSQVIKVHQITAQQQTNKLSLMKEQAEPKVQCCK